MAEWIQQLVLAVHQGRFDILFEPLPQQRADAPRLQYAQDICDKAWVAGSAGRQLRAPSVSEVEHGVAGHPAGTGDFYDEAESPATDPVEKEEFGISLASRKAQKRNLSMMPCE
ncbi:unnamed protein product, partial [Prorocentrum cordatum]